MREQARRRWEDIGGIVKPIIKAPGTPPEEAVGQVSEFCTSAALSLGKMARRASAAREKGLNLNGTIIAGMLAGQMDKSIPSRALAMALCRIGALLVNALC